MADSTPIKKTSTRNPNRMLNWALGSLTGIASFFAAYNRQMWNDSEAKFAKNEAYYKNQIELRDKKLEQKDKALDSVQGLILKRTDNAFEEFKSMFAIDTTKKSTVIIKTKIK